ncbi:MAG: class I SAM-dependent methyltransferase [Solirubrobacterales bacterium]|nr:class I SAM-dependent methyltransferase [Solirubrobacterales bacterium]
MAEETETQREPVALTPGSGADQNRQAYLSLLKLSLVDLAGARTSAVHFQPDGQMFTRDLKEDELKYRAAGIDWPVNGLTMTGLQRLDDLQECVEAIVRDGVEGDVIEAGTWRGGSSILMRATLDSLGENSRKVWLADSFSGFPEPDDESFPEDRNLNFGISVDLSKADFLAVPVEEVRGNFERLGLNHDLEFVEGFFEDTMEGLSDGRWSLVRLDGDTYESTMLSLRALYPGLAKGGYLVLDDYGFLPECKRAVEEFRAEHGITEPIEAIDWTGARWRKETEATTSGGDLGRGEGTDGSKRKVQRQSHLRIPSMRERDLMQRLEGQSQSSS